MGWVSVSQYECVQPLDDERASAGAIIGGEGKQALRSSGFRGELHDVLFERASAALMLVTPDGVLCCANRRARKQLVCGELLRNTSGRIGPSSRANRHVWEEALRKATPRPRIYALQSNDDVVGMVVRSLPDQPDLVLISLRPRQLPPVHRMAPLIEKYGLTIREIRMMRLLIGGLDVADASVVMRVATSTGRTYVKHLYGKLGIRTRSQLSSLVLRFCSVI